MFNPEMLYPGTEGYVNVDGTYFPIRILAISDDTTEIRVIRTDSVPGIVMHPMVIPTSRFITATHAQQIYYQQRQAEEAAIFHQRQQQELDALRRQAEQEEADRRRQAEQEEADRRRRQSEKEEAERRQSLQREAERRKEKEEAQRRQALQEKAERRRRQAEQEEAESRRRQAEQAEAEIPIDLLDDVDCSIFKIGDTVRVDDGISQVHWKNAVCLVLRYEKKGRLTVQNVDTGEIASLPCERLRKNTDIPRHSQPSSASAQPPPEPVKHEQIPLDLSEIPPNCITPFTTIYNDYKSQKGVCLRAMQANKNKKMIEKLISASISRLAGLRSISIRGDAGVRDCVAFPGWYETHKAWFINEFAEMQAALQEYNLNKVPAAVVSMPLDSGVPYNFASGKRMTKKGKRMTKKGKRMTKRSKIIKNKKLIKKSRKR